MEHQDKWVLTLYSIYGLNQMSICSGTIPHAGVVIQYYCNPLFDHHLISEQYNNLCRTQCQLWIEDRKRTLSESKECFLFVLCLFINSQFGLCS